MLLISLFLSVVYISCILVCCAFCCFFFFSSRRRHTRCALVTGVQTCALPISPWISSDGFWGVAATTAAKLFPPRIRWRSVSGSGGVRQHHADRKSVV